MFVRKWLRSGKIEPDFDVLCGIAPQSTEAGVDVKRTIAVLSAIAVAALVGAALAGAKQAPTVQLRSTALGKILVNSHGRTLYAFTRDKRNKDSCVRISGCASVWPMLKTSGSPTAGSGIKRSLLGTIRLSGGARQVTYAGHPLYMYSFDSGPGQTDYVGVSQFGGTWKALGATGKMVG
jgi:predicted lipoprotein with Yx(FWY)xxD motif